MVHPEPDDFDAFYSDARQRLLVQTYALTGDLRASRSAVRNAFVVAWHHWPRVTRSADPEGWVRAQAWARARRRHTARLWHRTKGLEHEARATLAALGSLTTTRRRLLLLAHLAEVSTNQMAREVALPRETAERELRAAAAAFAAERGVSGTDVRAAIEPLDGVVADEQWPRAKLLRRAGAARRRAHTSFGVVGAVVALVLVGLAVVGQGSGPGQVRPTLGTERFIQPPPEPARPSLGPDDLVTAGEARQLLPGRTWRVRKEGDNTEGNGLVVRCQQERFADPEGTAAAVRTFVAKNSKKNKLPRATAVQLSELSEDREAAREAFRKTASWYAGCSEPATLLGRTQALPTIANQAWLFELRSYRPDATTVVGVARSGLYTHTVARTVRSGAPRKAQHVVELLADAVDAKCGQAGAGACAGIPRGQPHGPLRVPPAPGLVDEYDLPAIDGIPRPWVGTDPSRAKVNTAATPCDETSFDGRRGNRTRTFLIPSARVPDAFGLTESIARFPDAGRARSFMGDVRGKLGSCSDGDSPSDVRTLARSSGNGRELAAWEVVTEVSDAQSVRYLMAVVRHGRAVAQVGFVPAGSRSITERDFLQLARRAQERLAFTLPKSSGGNNKKQGNNNNNNNNGGGGGGGGGNNN